MELSVEPEKLLVVQLKELLNDAGVPYPKNGVCLCLCLCLCVHVCLCVSVHACVCV